MLAAAEAQHPRYELDELEWDFTFETEFWHGLDQRDDQASFNRTDNDVPQSFGWFAEDRPLSEGQP